MGDAREDLLGGRIRNRDEKAARDSLDAARGEVTDRSDDVVAQLALEASAITALKTNLVVVDEYRTLEHR